MLKVDNLRKQYISGDGTPGGGVFGIGFEVAEGELFTLLGPSGCGKTTTLRSIAGLEEPDTGLISLAGRDIFNSESGFSLPMHERDIGMVFQSYAIWPHMNVFDNAAYPLVVSRKKRFSKKAIEEKVTHILEMVGMGEFIRRPSTQLSGGQQQRLALARALTREPGLLLLDEPLSNLDALLREQMRVELKRLQQESGVTSIYVTHDQSEALAISDRIAVMNEGHIMQVGTPTEIYDRPASRFVANFIGKTNLIQGELAGDAAPDSYGKVQTGLGAFKCFFPVSATGRQKIVFVVRPEKILLAGAETPDAASVPEDNRVKGVVQSEVYLGEIVEFTIGLDDGNDLIVRIPPGKDIATGDEVIAHFPPENTIALIEA